MPDFLSRSVNPSSDQPSVQVLEITSQGHKTDKWYSSIITKIQRQPLKFPKWRFTNGVLYKYVKCPFPTLSTESNYWKVVVPKYERRNVMKECHDAPTSGHAGLYKTYGRLSSQYYWPKMREDVARYVRECKTCGEMKPEQKAPAGLMEKRPKISTPWRMISLDLVGPLPRSARGYTQILVVTDYFSKYVVLFPLRSATSKAVCQCLEDGIFLVYGVPEHLICDNGSQLRSVEFHSLAAKYRVSLLYTALYSPHANPTERTNRTMKTMLRAYIKKNYRKWDQYLSSVGCAMRTAKSEVNGFTPFFVNFGREHIISGRQYNKSGEHEDRTDCGGKADDVLKRQEGYKKMFRTISEKLVKAHQKNERSYNLRRRDVS